MKIVVIGGTGLIGSKVIVLLRGGHDTLAAAPNTGVNTVTGQGLEAALNAADVVVDVANSPSFEPSAVMGFFYGAREEPSCRRSSRQRPTSRRAIDRRRRSFAG